MKTVISRFLYKTPGHLHNPLMFPFLLITGALGVAFTFFSGTAPVQAAVLFLLTTGHMPDLTISIWGVLALALTFGTLAGIIVRWAWLGELTTWTGVGLWLYATLLYALYGFWLQFLTAGIPSLFFWVWYWFYVRDYHRKHLTKP